MSGSVQDWYDSDFPYPHLDDERINDVSPAGPDIDWESVEI